jgi:hypothetical protein
MKKLEMPKIENAAMGIIFGAVPIITCFIAGWWISIPFVAEAHVYQYALAGILFGILIDVIFIKKWIRNAFSIKPWIWMAVYLFYSIGMLGFFMGVPVFNVLLALPAGAFVGLWQARTQADFTRMHKAARQTAKFTSSILGVVCITSATLALLSPSTAYDLQGMLGLPFQVTRGMIVGIILGGGAMLLALGWWFTVRSVQYSFGYFSARVKHLSD